MQIYVGTYKKYNEGSLFGKWLELEDYDNRDAFYEACAELHADEEDPEFMFQDWEEIPSDMIGVCHVDEAVWDLIEAFDCRDKDAVMAYIECFGDWSLDRFDQLYRGHFDSWANMAEELLEEQGILNDVPDSLRRYIDFDSYSRDIKCSGEMCEHDGHFFWND